MKGLLEIDEIQNLSIIDPSVILLLFELSIVTYIFLKIRDATKLKCLAEAEQNETLGRRPNT